MNARKKLLTTYICTALIIMTGCATGTITRTAYNTLASSAEAYDATMTSLSQLYEKGEIGDVERTMAIQYGERFWVAYHTAVDALDAYYNGSGSVEHKKSTVYAAMAALSRALGQFLEYSQAIAKGGV